MAISDNGCTPLRCINGTGIYQPKPTCSPVYWTDIPFNTDIHDYGLKDIEEEPLCIQENKWHNGTERTHIAVKRGQGFWYEALGGGDFDRCSWLYLPSIKMNEARCEPANEGQVPAGSYIAGPKFGDFHRTRHDIPIKSYGLNETENSKRHQTIRKHHHPHHDDRRFFMLLDRTGEGHFKACNPACVDVKWSLVPVRKRIPGFGRKRSQDTPLPADFIPRDLFATGRSFKRTERAANQPPIVAFSFPNTTSPYIPWINDAVSYRAVMNTPFKFDFEKCVSHMQHYDTTWTEEERCHRIDWSDIPLDAVIAGFDRRKNDSTPTDRIRTKKPSIVRSHSNSIPRNLRHTKRVDDRLTPVVQFEYTKMVYVAAMEANGHRMRFYNCNLMVNLAFPDDACVELRSKTGVHFLMGYLVPLTIGTWREAGGTVGLMILTSWLWNFWTTLVAFTYGLGILAMGVWFRWWSTH